MSLMPKELVVQDTLFCRSSKFYMKVVVARLTLCRANFHQTSPQISHGLSLA
ncbi:hypothetical protein SAMN05444680_12076 [Variovorax sp. YR216]|nr:hypothetical protein SAMN05444680_12076 [Variovorax sp. YR216]